MPLTPAICKSLLHTLHSVYNFLGYSWPLLLSTIKIELQSTHYFRIITEYTCVLIFSFYRHSTRFSSYVPMHFLWQKKVGKWIRRTMDTAALGSSRDLWVCSVCVCLCLCMCECECVCERESVWVCVCECEWVCECECVCVSFVDWNWSWATSVHKKPGQKDWQWRGALSEKPAKETLTTHTTTTPPPAIPISSLQTPHARKDSGMPKEIRLTATSVTKSDKKHAAPAKRSWTPNYVTPLESHPTRVLPLAFLAGRN